MSTDGAISQRMQEETERTSAAMAHAVLDPKPIRTPKDIAHAFNLAVQGTWLDGLEVGMTLALRDMASARRWLAWYRKDMLEGDPESIADSEETATRIMEVLDA